MSTDVSPDRQNIDGVFSNTNYKIDFYQREYKWKEEQVETLLNDIFHVFEPDYKKLETRDPSKKAIHEFRWYYLSTYVTNIENGKTYVVDGQQRLTTLTLILIALYNIADRSGLRIRKWIEEKIMGHGPGGSEEFWIGHGKREEPLNKIYNDKYENLDIVHDLTAKNMKENYEVISRFLQRKLNTEHKLEMFIYYILLRVVMVRLDVESRTDVPMVLEIINDRGVTLKPYEILKGKLLSKIDRAEIDKYNDTWEKEVGRLDYEDQADDFFETYLSSRFAKTRKEAQSFRDYYHRLIFNPKYDKELKLGETKRVKDFVKNEITYFTGLYTKLKEGADSYNEFFPHVRYNGLTQMDSQFLLILSVCERNDDLEDKKIKKISEQLDRLYVLLHLNKAYDSNTFADSIYDIRTELAASNTSNYEKIFNESLFAQIEKSRDVRLENPLPYRFFNQIGYEDLNQRFLRYFFMRVEEFIAEGIGKKLTDSRYNFVRNSGSKNGYHIEHILANNEENLQLFNGEEEEFQRERHRLGALLLLNNRNNLSSGNEIFEKKKDTYATTLYWNQSLRENFTKSKPNNREFLNRNNLNLAVKNKFDKNALEKRTSDLYKITRKIWC